VFPVRGQIVELDGPPGLLPRVTFFGRAYAIPRFDGKLVIGSTMEPVGFDKRTTEEGIARVRATAEHAIPALKALPFVRAWAGLRPGTKDGLPLLGESDVQGLLLSTGHFRNGVLLAAESARLIADLVDGKTPGFDLSPFAPQRFA
jgi:glycine oxidase